MTARSLLFLATVLAGVPSEGIGQPTRRAASEAESPASDSAPPSATARWENDRYLHRRSTLEFVLTRALRSGERLALVVGNTDVSMMVEVDGARVRYRPAGWRLPSGESEAVAFLVDAGGQWREIGRAALKVLTRTGLERARVVPSLDLSSTGQLDKRVDPASPPPRRAYQDITLRIGLENTFARGGWELVAQGNAVGVSEETQRLRWGEEQSDAPAVDLSDYRIQAGRGESRVAIGHVSAGGHRHLLSGFASRGLTADVRLGGRAAVNVAVVNGSNVVGWNNVVGLDEPDHRIATGTLSLELLPTRPGALHLDVSGMDGSILPQSSYNEGAATDAETSRGWGFQLSASDARQRIRISGGIARSRFVNPNDPLLSAGATLVAVRPTTRAARYGELSLQLLQGLELWRNTEAALAATVRHERIDPLYRSTGGNLQSDVQSDGLEVTGTLGALSFRMSATAARDNLGKIASILTSRTRGRSVSLAAPLGQVLGAPNAWYLPSLSYSWQRTHQYGEGVPRDGDFTETHVPDQWSTAQSGSAVWSAATWNLTYRWSQSFQDNRQTGRERADFRGVVHALSLSSSLLRSLTPSLEASVERQKNIESGLTQRTERLGVSAVAQLTRTTALNGSLTHARSFDPFSDQRALNTEFHVELSQGFNIYRRVEGGMQARLFLRYAQTGVELLPSAPTADPGPRVTWTLNAGSSIRLY